MAGRALQLHVGSGERKLGPRRMIKLHALPLSGVVALGAVLWKRRADVIRRGRLIEGIQMAALARCRCGGEIAVHVALAALRAGVGASQRELSASRVVELPALPLHSRVADTAVLGESGFDVIRVHRLIEGSQVATFTRLRRTGELAVDMATGTIHLNVGAGQTDAAQIVVELRTLPLNRGVALRALV